MVPYPGKYYFLIAGLKDAQKNFSYDNIKIKNHSEEKILGTSIDNKLTALVKITNFISPAL